MTSSKQELVARAKELAPKIAKRAKETERLRAPHDDTIKDLIDAELIEILVPKKWGGHELGLDTFMEVTEIISAACMSTGWISLFYIGHNWMVMKFGEQVQREVFDGKPYGLIPGATAPTLKAKKVDGGWEVNGRATWGTGIMHADWVFMGGVSDSGLTRQFIIPVEDVSIDDVWHMTGMSGTGSNDFVVNDVFVPDYRSMPAEEFVGTETEGTRLHDNPLYQMPLFPFIYIEAVGVWSGGLRGALNSYDEIVRNKVTTHAGTVVKDKQHSQIRLGEAHLSVLIAESLAREQLRVTDVFLQGDVTNLQARAELKARIAFLVEHCRASVNKMMHQAGSASFNEDVPLQRFFRDMNFLSTHAFWDWAVCREQVGRAQLGLEPTTPLL